MPDSSYFQDVSHLQLQFLHFFQVIQIIFPTCSLVNSRHPNRSQTAKSGVILNEAIPDPSGIFYVTICPKSNYWFAGPLVVKNRLQNGSISSTGPTSSKFLLLCSKWKREIFPTQNLLETEFGSEESTPGPDYVSISRNTVEMWWFFWAAVRRKARIFKSGEHKRFGKTRNRAIEW